MNALKTLVCALTLGATAVAVTAPAQAASPQDIIAGFMAQGAGPGDAANGQKLYLQTESMPNYGGGKEDTPNCTTCHGKTPQQGGMTRTQKAIGPMAASAGYKDDKTGLPRYTDKEKVDKWFLRNCQGVLGRECTAQEKVDFITYMLGQ